MGEIWIIALGTLGTLAVCRILLARRPVANDFVDDREERLSRRMADLMGCLLTDAQSAIRREMRIAPDQTDETLLKRARYHYLRDSPDLPCGVYRDRAPG